MTTATQALAIPERVRERAPFLRRLRLGRSRLFASLMTFIGRRPAGCRLIVRLRSSSLFRSIADWCVGFRRTFKSFEEAQSCASKYIPEGHEHPDEADYHLSIAGTLRESDYPVLFYLAPLAPQIKKVFDLGGNVGNLFYSYQRQLSFSPTLAWLVYDLPPVRSLGEIVAVKRGENRVQFVDDIASGRDSDVFIASGSLHYFEQPLDEILQSLGSLPRHVFVNRTPCSIEDDLVTVQDNGSFLVPCKLHSRSKLIERMHRAGYRLVAEWPVFERRLWVPMYPDSSPRTYSGFYFRKKDTKVSPA